MPVIRFTGDSGERLLTFDLKDLEKYGGRDPGSSLKTL
jgi:hypothetical protein